MKDYLLKILPVVWFILIGISSQEFAQDSLTTDNLKIKNIISHFESGIKTGAVKDFSDYLYSETYISLETGIAAHFSANQSFYILKDYLQHYRPISFRVLKSSINNGKPYAIGKLIYNKVGVKGESQVFVSLKQEDGQWKIYQITIN